MKLYGYWRSSTTWRVRIALALKNIEYEYVPVNLLSGEQKSSEHLARNPQGLVPVLEPLEGTYLTQSLAIIHYLEKKFPDRSLYPEDPIKAAKAEAIAIMITGEAQPFGNLRVLTHLKKTHNFDDEAIADWMNLWPGKTLGAVNELLPEEGSFFSNDRPGLPEVFLIPQLYAARRFGTKLEKFTKILALEKKCEALESFQKAHPDNQPDKPG